jgi:hypothetical protein
MCDHCSSEGCACGNIEGYRSPCQCGTTIGLRSCPDCGCNCEAWWTGIKISVDGKDGVIGDYLSDNYFDPNPSQYPATREKVIQDLLGYGMQNGSAEYQWIMQSLPQRTFKDVSDVAFALISHLPPIRWERVGQGDFVWKYPAEKVAFGQQLQVGQDQKVILLGANGKKACDSFGPGSYTISNQNCPVLASNSRKLGPGLGEGQTGTGVLDGFPVFVYPLMEFEIDLSVMGQTKALRRISARGVARFRISDSGLFLEQVGSNGNFNTEPTVSALRKFCEELLKKEMSNHEFDDLKNNSQLLESTLSQGAKSVGLDPVKMTFSWIGEVGPGIFAGAPGGVPPQMTFDPQKIAQMRQMAESMRAAQMAGGWGAPQTRGAGVKPTSQQPSSQVPAGTSAVKCPSCNFTNQANNKFCNNCGRPLSSQQARVCSNCGQKQPDPSIKFCGNCGTRLP